MEGKDKGGTFVGNSVRPYVAKVWCGRAFGREWLIVSEGGVSRTASAFSRLSQGSQGSQGEMPPVRRLLQAAPLLSPPNSPPQTSFWCPGVRLEGCLEGCLAVVPWVGTDACVWGKLL